MRILIFLLFCSQFAAAQLTALKKDSAFVDFIEGLTENKTFKKSVSYQKEIPEYIYIMSSDDIYNYFGYDSYVKFRDFNFTEYHILGQQICKQCKAFCNHESGNQNCHRNVCVYSWQWTKRKNKKAFTEIPSQRSLSLSAAIVKGIKYSYSDTVLYSSTDSSNATWVTHSGGDCHAHFKFGVFSDNYYPVLVLKEWNYYGGCRAGGSWQFAINFNMPSGILQKSKNVILVDEE